jgi:lipopolysaccharide export system protein LptC
MDLKRVYIILGILVLILLSYFGTSNIKPTETVSLNEVQKMVSETMN